jgi:hypothetical protein
VAPSGDDVPSQPIEREVRDIQQFAHREDLALVPRFDVFSSPSWSEVICL